MTTNDEHQGYLAYMLRLWRVDGSQEPAWRASLESPHTGERHVFIDLGALFSFLEHRTGDRHSSATAARPNVEDKQHS